MEMKDIIKRRRLELNLTQKEVADYVGVSEATLSRWESGEIKNLRRNRIAALAKILDVSPSVIVGDDAYFETLEAEMDALSEQVEEYRRSGNPRIAEEAQERIKQLCPTLYPNLVIFQELQGKTTPAPESGLSEARRALLDAIDGMSEEEIYHLIDVIAAVKGMRK